MNNNILISGLLALCGLFYAFVEAPQHGTVDTVLMDERNVEWMTWDEAIAAGEKAKAAGEKPKKIFVDVYTDWCSWCKRMDQETFERKQIAAYLNHHYYPVKFNAEQRETITFQGTQFKYVSQGSRGYHELALALLEGKMSYPTVVFLNENVEVIQRLPGYLKHDVFDMVLHYFAGDYHKSTPWAVFQDIYKKQRAQQVQSQQSSTPVRHPH